MGQLTMKSGELWTAVLAGDNGKPRPVADTPIRPPSVSPQCRFCPLSGSLRDFDFRIVIEPSPDNGLSKLSQVMVDRIIGVPRTRLRTHIGQLEAWELTAVQEALLLITGIER